MCKKSNACTYVALNDKVVDCPAIRPLHFDSYFSSFVNSVLEMFYGKSTKDMLLLPSESERELNSWFSEHAQMASTFRKQTKNHQAPKGSKRDTKPLTQSMVHVVNRRDNYRCRYCSNPVVPSNVFKAVGKLVGFENFITKGTNLQRNGIKLVYSATADHVIPRVDGGATAEDNLVTACWPCNYGKANFTVVEIGLTDPHTRMPLSMDSRIVDLQQIFKFA